MISPKFFLAPLSALALLMISDALQANPPTQGLGRNSLGVTSTGGARYRPQRPTISPYLALAPQGVGQLGSINYYILVRPQFAQQQINQEQGAELERLESRVSTDEDRIARDEAAAKNPQTGNRASFMTQDRYFGVRTNSGVQPKRIQGAGLRNQLK